MAVRMLAVALLAAAANSTACGFHAVVSGASGYLGAELVRQLLQTGNRVTALVRSSAGCAVVERVEAAVKGNKPVSSQLQTLNIPDISSMQGLIDLQACLAQIDEAADDDGGGREGGCVVFHTAGPFVKQWRDAEAEVVTPWVRGTQNIVTAILAASSRNRAQTSSRLILTSSSAALRGPGSQPMNGDYFTASDWNNSSRRDGPGMQPYQWAKTESERRAWELCQEHGIGMTTFLPSFLLGPSAISPSSRPLSPSLSFMRSWLEGSPVYESRLIADLRDVAALQITAARDQSAVGRRVIVSTPTRIAPERVASILKDAVGLDVRLDEAKCRAAFPSDRVEVDPYALSNAGEILHGFRLRPVEETIGDMAKWMLGPPGMGNGG